MPVGEGGSRKVTRKQVRALKCIVLLSRWSFAKVGAMEQVGGIFGCLARERKGRTPGGGNMGCKANTNCKTAPSEEGFDVQKWKAREVPCQGILVASDDDVEYFDRWLTILRVC